MMGALTWQTGIFLFETFAGLVILLLNLWAAYLTEATGLGGWVGRYDEGWDVLVLFPFSIVFFH